MSQMKQARQKLTPWKARSCWATGLAVAIPLAAVVGIDIPGLVGAETEAGAIDKIVGTVGAAAAAWALFERKAPNFDLDLSLRGLFGRGE